MGQAGRSVVLITGTSSGFGLVTTVALAKRGYQVVATMRDLKRKSNLTKAIQEAEVEDSVTLMELDVTNEAQIASVVAETLRQFHRLDVLVNNAGFAIGGFVEDVPMETWRHQFETNVFGAIAMSKAVLPHMRQAQSGLIINIGSISGRFGFPCMGPYCSSKFALAGFSESLRLEMAPYGVRVVLVEPASYRTDVWDKGIAQAKSTADSPYQREMRVVMKSVKAIAAGGGDPTEVARLIERIVHAQKPKLRYPIGRGVHGLLMAKSLLPWQWVERMVVRRFRI